MSPDSLDPDVARVTLLASLLALAAVSFFVLRPELWRRLFFAWIDPRPAALMRIAFGAVLLWAWIGLIPLGRELFTDEGMWLTEQARGRDRMQGYLWDPVEGFDGLAGLLAAISRPFTVLHLRSDPTFVAVLWGALLVALALMTVGLWTRVSTVVAWLLMHQLYGYSSIFFSSADSAMRVFLFLGMFLRWGEAYSLDAWRRPRPLGPIPAWPQRLMMFQLALIYFTSGWLKTGVEWKNGTALYYVLNLDHFYRVPLTGFVALLQRSGLLVVSTWIVRVWELCFPLVLLGLAVRTWEQERAAGIWPSSVRWRRTASWVVAGAFWLMLAAIAGIAAYHYWPPRPHPFGVTREGLRVLFFAAVALVPVVIGVSYWAVRRRWPSALAAVLPWLLGRRLWLGLGVAMHLGIALTMSVGSFSQVMLATYFPWLNGRDVDRLESTVLTRAGKRGHEGRPVEDSP